ncbi:MAG TPA: ATP-grasp domain-containing protein [Bacilli bacterium]|nr:ATP-grasp domain-containing protein [Bacilli bacterium]
MSQILLFVESNTTGTGMLALKQARSWGLRPMFLTHNPDRYLGLSETGADVLVCDTNSLDALRATIRENVKAEELAGIATTSEFYLEACAEIAREYGLPGNPPDAIRTCRNKALTRQTLLEAGVHQPRFAKVQRPEQVAAAVAEVGLPLVVKPADDSGSNFVKLCRTEEEVHAQAEQILAVHTNARGQQTAQTVLLEQFLDAPEYSVEMFSWEGKTTLVGITQKTLTGFPFFVESKHIFPAPVSEDVWEQMRVTVERALAATGIRNGATHTEIKWTEQGAAIVEINARLAGGMIPELIRHATGIDLLETQIRSAVQEPQGLAAEYRCHAGIRFLIAETSGVLQAIEGVDAARALPGIEQIAVTKQAGAQVQPPQNFSHRLGFVIATGATAEETEARLDAALKQIQVVVTPQPITQQA